MRKLLLITDINPEAWTAPDLGTIRKGGRVIPTASPKPLLVAYKLALKESISRAYPDLEMFPPDMPLRLQFVVWRNLDEYKTPTGRNQTRHRIDATNFQKATEDALQGLLFKNDTMIAKVSTEWARQAKDTPPRILIICEPYKRDIDWDAAIRTLAPADEWPTPPGNVYLEETP